MIDTDNLRTASLYINNQLLSRGLLRDGESIDFANPGEDYDEVAAAMGRIISVVNDLILRRDRDAEQRESLSTTMRALRADNLKHVNDMSRLLEKNTEAKRKLDIAESSEATLKIQLKSAEAAARGLKDEVARTKALVAQARASCATEVRRRDRQIDTLKKQLGEAGRARGSRSSSAITTITVTGDIGEEKSSPRSGSIPNEDYSLRSETNAFLAELAQNLSEENEALMKVMHTTLKQLRDMSGWNLDDKINDHVLKQATSEDMAASLDSVLEHMRTILTNPSFVPIEEVMVREEEISRLKDGWVKMEDRWKEAVHLIDGWRRRMASSGRAVCEEELKMGLRLSPVRVRDVEETRHAIDTRLGAVAEESEEDVHALLKSPSPAHGTAHLGLIDRYEEQENDGQSDDESSILDDDQANDDYDVEEPNVEILEQSAVMQYPKFDSSRDSSPLPEPPQLSPLRNSPAAGNRGMASPTRAKQRPGDFTTIMEENTWDTAGDAKPPQPPPHRTKPSPTRAQPSETAHRPLGRQRSPTRTSLDDALLGTRSVDESGPASNESPVPEPKLKVESEPKVRETRSSPQQTPRATQSRLPLPAAAEQGPQQSPLTMATIAAKLAASEREADAARVRAKLKAVRGTRGVKKPNLTPARPEARREPKKPVLETGEATRPSKDVDPVKQDVAPQELQPTKRKRDTKTTKAASRRRSTLSPWELESLMAGKV
ncbi:hypothetical protein HJFPF1_01931 [Paramyrothecium foliicola]|nr:hypothetical protein HJFPF1_01931 [Paramyrothecium foliicola]